MNTTSQDNPENVNYPYVWQQARDVLLFADLVRSNYKPGEVREALYRVLKDLRVNGIV